MITASLGLETHTHTASEMEKTAYPGVHSGEHGDEAVTAQWAV